MDTKALKDKILQLAIQGRLVEQDINDEPASVLLEKIAEEKERLIKEKKKNKEKPFPEIKEEEKPFGLPKGWEWCRLRALIDITSGKNLTKNNMNETGVIPVYGGNGITGFHDGFNVSEKTIVIGRVGFYCGSVHLTEEKAWVTDNAFITSYPSKLINREFLIFLLKSINLRGKQNSTAQPVISGKKVYPIVVAIPPLSEQERIVAKVDELFAIIDELDNNKQDLLQNIADSRSKILQLAIQGKLVEQNEEDEPASVLLERIAEEKERLIKEKKIKREKPLPRIKEEEKPFEVPKGWEWVRLAELSFKITDGSHNPPRGEDNSTDYLMLSSQNINENKIVELIKCRYLSKQNYEVENKRTQVKKGDVLLTIVGTIGRSCIFKEDFNITLQRSVGVIDTKYCNNYLKYLFDSPGIQKQFNEKATGTAQRGIYLNQLKQMIISLPPLSEQKRIVEKLDILMVYLDSLQKEIELN